MNDNRFSRRHFFYGTLLAGAVPRGGFGSTPSLKLMGYKSPNEKLNVASIGAGGRAAADIAGVAPTENMVAFADPDDKSAAATFKSFDKAQKYKDFRRMLDKEKGIDAVIVAIPDHMHATAAMWAMERGKHVYVEKPLTRTVAEARMLSEAAAKYRVATQMGNQGYSNEGARIAAEIIWSGEIGNVTEVHAWTNRPIWPQGLTEIPPPDPVPATLDWDLWLGIAKERPYTSGGASSGNRGYGFYQPFNWRGFFDFGCGALGDMACHILGAPNMALRLTAPTSVECIKKEGTSPFQFPKKSVTRFEFPARGSMPPVKLFWYDAATTAAYRPAGVPENEPIIGGAGAFGARGQAFSGTGAVPNAAAAPAAPTAPEGGRGQGGRGGRAGGGGGGGAQNNGAVFIGEKGILTTDTYGANVRLLPMERMKDYKLPPESLTRSPGHHRDWIRACKGGDPSCSNFSVAGPLTEWIVLGVVAVRVEGKLEWDSAKMKFTNSAEANRYVKPEVRKGWSIG
ncbi:MAG TPA: Gfo/Idh/MocA family oxidoreductase [Bryobacteraceae bacterium]|nr:Gfo/Idh/MocA family oxidoreductase [Bryobacteraceae bacterium]